MPTPHPDLLTTQTLIYDACGIAYTQPIAEAESADYSACTFAVNGMEARFRVAKTTPTKTGQFVTLWKREGKGPIQPFDVADPVELFIISTRKGNELGQFVFPKEVLLQQDIVSLNNQGGKRAIRVYPPWDVTTSKQAQRTQQWQLNYFVHIPANQPVDPEQAAILYLQQKKPLT